jgi:hypothetical protein
MTARHAAPLGAAEIRLAGGTATPLATKADVQKLYNPVRRHRERWAVIDQLVAGLAPIQWMPVAPLAPEPCDDWAEVLVQAAAFAHVRVSPDCRGYTHWSSGGAGCGCCGWGTSARMRDVGTTGSARFSQAALARVGQAIALAVDELVQVLFEAVLPC